MSGAMQTEPELSIAGQFLVAMPLLADPNFHRTVTCLCEYSSKGALGIVINRHDARLTGKDVFSQLKIDYTPEAGAVPVHLGGPVHPNELFILHGPPLIWEGTHEFQKGLALSNTMDLVEAIAQSRGPEKYIIALGCAGWGPGQLDFELTENTWITAPIDREVLFDLPVDSRWETVLARNGINPALLSGTAGHA